MVQTLGVRTFRALWLPASGVLGAVLLLAQSSAGQTTPADGSQPGPPPASPRQPGEVVDRVVAVVNQDPVLDSDIDEQRRLIAFQPITDPTGAFSRQRALQRLINRTLILQQAKIQGQPPIPDSKVNAELDQLKKDLPACKQAHCETDAGWQQFVTSHGFTVPELTDLWRQRMEVLQFIELRFRGGIRVTPEQISTYYKETLLPEYRKQGVTPPKPDAVSDRVREVLLEQQVSSLLNDWLRSLRAQGSVRIMNAGDTLPEEGVEP